MLEQAVRQAILELHRRGQGVRAIARALRISRAAVRDVLRRGSAEVPRLARPEKASSTARTSCASSPSVRAVSCGCTRSSPRPGSRSPIRP